MKTITVPEADMLLVTRSSNNERKSILNFAPRIGLTIVDYGRTSEIDSFYLACQSFRDYYRDPYHKLTRPAQFRSCYGKCGNRHPDRNSELLMRPIEWIREKQPIIYPLDYTPSSTIDQTIRLDGCYNPTSCTKYKR